MRTRLQNQPVRTFLLALTILSIVLGKAIAQIPDNVTSLSISNLGSTTLRPCNRTILLNNEVVS
jgi:hypothetical protein